MNHNGLPDLPDEVDVKKRQMIIVGIIVLAAVLIFSYIYATSPGTKLGQGTSQRPVTQHFTTPGDSNDPIQNWVLQNDNRMKALELDREKDKQATDNQMAAMMAEIKKLSLEKDNLTSQLTQQARPSGFPEIALPSVSSLPINSPATLALPGSDPATSLESKQPQDPGKSIIDRVTMNPGAKTGILKIKFGHKKGKKSRPHIRDTIPAGSFGQAVLLSGLDAPTGGLAERNPHPVLLELLNNGSLPNRYRHKVKSCRIVASGTGNISDERAYLRLERLTCVLRNGDVVSEVATGTVTGEDGKNGLRGTLVTKQGQLIANAFWAGALSGIGDAIAASYTAVSTSANGTVSTVDPGRLAETGLASGTSNTLEKIADWYFKRAEETYPIIEVSAGRIVNVFLTEDLALNANLLANYTPEDSHE